MQSQESQGQYLCHHRYLLEPSLPYHQGPQLPRRVSSSCWVACSRGVFTGRRGTSRRSPSRHRLYGRGGGNPGTGGYPTGQVPSELTYMMITIAAASVIKGVVLLVWGSETVPSILLRHHVIHILGATVTSQVLCVIGLLAIVTVGLSLFLNRTLFRESLEGIGGKPYGCEPHGDRYQPVQAVLLRTRRRPRCSHGHCDYAHYLYRLRNRHAHRPEGAGGRHRGWVDHGRTIAAGLVLGLLRGSGPALFQPGLRTCSPSSS